VSQQETYHERDEKMIAESDVICPPIGTVVQVWFYANSYRATIVKHGKKHPVVRFKLKNGRVIEGAATVLKHGADHPAKHHGYLCHMYRPDFYQSNDA
jgi:hypothetical protein